jgi:hypothetical protein
LYILREVGYEEVQINDLLYLLSSESQHDLVLKNPFLGRYSKYYLVRNSNVIEELSYTLPSGGIHPVGGPEVQGAAPEAGRDQAGVPGPQAQCGGLPRLPPWKVRRPLLL